MEPKIPDWLSLESLLDQGQNKALYPYPLLKNILSADECREAVLDETLGYEEEFGLSFVNPLYQLLWRFNTIGDIFTSHLLASPRDYKSPFEWANHLIGTAIIMLPRKQSDRHELRVAEGMARMLAKILGESSFTPTDTRGWQIRVFPTTINCAYQSVLTDSNGAIVSTEETDQQLGYAHEIIISGSAGIRPRAADRWVHAVTFVLQTLAPLIEQPPYQHYALVDGERTPISPRASTPSPAVT